MRVYSSAQMRRVGPCNKQQLSGHQPHYKQTTDPRLPWTHLAHEVLCQISGEHVRGKTLGRSKGGIISRLQGGGKEREHHDFDESLMHVLHTALRRGRAVTVLGAVNQQLMGPCRLRRQPSQQNPAAACLAHLPHPQPPPPLDWIPTLLSACTLRAYT